MAYFNYIRLHSGKQFNFINPDIDSIDIQDIAHSLSMQCRYVGHSKSHYSIAQHSVLVSRNLPPGHKLPGLLHDAGEAYCSDINSPLKNLLPDYKAMEKVVDELCMRRFGLNYPISPVVKDMDLRLLTTELRDLMPGEDYKIIEKDYPPLEEVIEPWTQDYAKYTFLKEFYALYGAE